MNGCPWEKGHTPGNWPGLGEADCLSLSQPTSVQRFNAFFFPDGTNNYFTKRCVGKSPIIFPQDNSAFSSLYVVARRLFF